jgi:hypothetical protein
MFDTRSVFHAPMSALKAVAVWNMLHAWQLMQVPAAVPVAPNLKAPLPVTAAADGRSTAASEQTRVM